MLVVTADRPPELRDVGAPQTIDQTQLYRPIGALVPRPRCPRRRRCPDVAVAGVPCAATPRATARCTSTCRSASRSPARPVSSPLRRDASRHPRRVATGRRRQRVQAGATGAGVGGAVDRQRGVIIAGGRGAACPSSASRRSPTRPDGRCSPTRRAAPDRCRPRSRRSTRCCAIGSSPTRTSPEVVVRIGRPPASRVLAEWIARSSRRGRPGRRPGCHRSRPRRRVRVRDRRPRRSPRRHRHDVGGALAARREAGAGGDRGGRWPATSRSPSPAWRTCVADLASRRRRASSWPRRCPCATSSGSAGRGRSRACQPRRQRHRRRGVDRARPGVDRHADGRPRRRHRLRARLQRARSVSAIDGRPADRRRRQRRRWHLLVPPAGDRAPRRSVRDLLGTPHGTDIEGLARAHGIPASTITDAPASSPSADAAGSVARPRPDEPGRERRRPRAPERRRRRRPRLPIRPVASSGRQGRMMAESIAWNLACVSASSASGSLSATMPPPATSRADAAISRQLGAADARRPTCRCRSRRPSRPRRRTGRARTLRPTRSARAPRARGWPPTAGVG